MAARVIMVTSGKGGTGKSTLSVLLGGALAAQKKNVLLVELDAGLRSVDLIAGVSSQTVFDLGDILSGNCKPDKALTDSPIYPGLHVLCAPYSAATVNGRVFVSFIHALRNVVDFIILDTAAGLGDAFKAASACLTAQDMALLVLTPDIISARDGRIAVNALPAVQPPEIRIVFNKVTDKPGAGLAALDDAIDMVGAQLLGVVPYSEEVLFAADGKALTSGTAKTAIHNIARRLGGEYVPLAVR